MGSRRSALTALGLCLLLAVPLQGQTFARTYGGIGPDRPAWLHVKPGGGVVAIGSTGSFGAGSLDLWLMETNAAGDLVSEWTYGTGEQEWEPVAAAAPDGGWVLASSTFAGPGQNLWVIKLRADLSLEWQKRFDGGATDRPVSVVVAASGEITVAATTSSFGAGDQDGWLLRLDSSGNVLWQEAIGGPGDDRFASLVETPDGGILAAARTASFTQDSQDTWDAWLVRLDAAGQILWEKHYGTSDSEGPESNGSSSRALLATSAGTYVLAGETSATNGGAGWLLEIDADGAVLQSKLYGGPSADTLLSLAELPGGDLLAVGTSRSFSPGRSEDDLWVLQLDAGREIVWQAAYGGDEHDQGRTALPVGTGLAILGDNLSFGLPGPDPLCRCDCVTCPTSDFWVLWTDHAGAMDGSCTFVRPAGAVSQDVPAMAADTAATVRPTAILPVDTAGVALQSSGQVQEQCYGFGCAELTCEELLVDPDPVCEGEPQDLTLQVTGGAGLLLVEWDLDGDGVHETPGNPIRSVLRAGLTEVSARATDECAQPSPQSCTLRKTATIYPAPTPIVTPSRDPAFCQEEGERLTLDAGAGYTSYQWLRDGTAIPGATGPGHDPVADGDYSVHVTDGNGCEGDSAVLAVRVDACEPGEVSAVRLGEPPLRVESRGSRLRVEAEPRATAYNIHVDSLGSWYAPSLAKGTQCHLRTWTDNGDGTVTLDAAVPAGSWFVVTASNPHGEGPAGPDSAGTERTDRGNWELCGPAL